VATGLGDGAHHFSKTLEEHNSAVQTYLVRLREQERRARARPPITPDAEAVESTHPERPKSAAPVPPAPASPPPHP